MRFRSSLFRSTALVLPLALVTACGDSTGPDGLSPEEVSGAYFVCELVFTPANAVFNPVDIVATAMEASPSGSLLNPPNLRLDPEGVEFVLEYVPEGQVIAQDPGGDYRPRSETVRLEFSSSGAAQAADILLPGALVLDFSATPKMLSTPVDEDGAPEMQPYAVDSEDYAELAGISAEGLADEISGRLTARFQVDSCTP